MSTAPLLLASLALALGSAAMLVRASDHSTAKALTAVYDITPQQAEWIADGVPSGVALSLHPSCVASVNVSREFPVVVSCPDEVQP